MLSSNLNKPISDPLWDSQPANSVPAFKAVNLATLEEVFIPEELGFETISKGGLSLFSNTVQVQSAP